MSLSPAPPRVVDRQLRPNVGDYYGQIDEVRWGYPTGWLMGQVERAALRQRWFEVVIASDHALFRVRIEDSGTTGAAEVEGADLRTGRELFFHRAEGIPLASVEVGPFVTAQAKAWLRGPGVAVELDGTDEGWNLRVSWRQLTLRASIARDEVHGAVHVRELRPKRGTVSQMFNGLEVQGRAEMDGLQFPFDHARACVSYVNGFLPAKRSWSHLTVLGRPGDSLAFHLSSSPRLLPLVWSDGKVFELPSIVMRRADAHVRSPVEVVGDGIALQFTPHTVRELREGWWRRRDRRISAGFLRGHVTVDGVRKTLTGAPAFLDQGQVKGLT